MYFILLQCTVALFSVLPTGVQVVWLSPTNHDFGTISRNKPVECVFLYKNTGKTPVVIDNVRTTCGCTAPDWSEAPVLPDSTGRIRVQFFPREAGPFRKKIKVFFHHQRHSDQLFVEGEVE